MQSIIYNFAVVDSVFLQNEAWTGSAWMIKYTIPR
jgi:hypothetical protein